MGLLNSLFERDTLKEPLLLKEGNSAQKQLEALKELEASASGAGRKKLQREIKLVEAGIYGENQVLYELKNSFMPMVILHDIYFEKDGTSAQIDFLVVTRKRCYILECKNMVGDITIDAGGNFARKARRGWADQAEPIYSPIRQNQIHLELVKKIRGEAKKGRKRKQFERDFEESYRPVLVLANPKMALYAQKAPKEIQDQVVRGDQLVQYIRRQEEACQWMFPEKNMLEVARFFADNSVENPTDYRQRYQQMLAGIEEAERKEEQPTPKRREEGIPLCPSCHIPMVKRVSRKGRYAGRSFYGCPNYPRCREIINIKQDDTP